MSFCLVSETSGLAKCPQDVAISFHVVWNNTWQIVIASRIPPRPYSTEACHSGTSCVGEQVMRFMTVVTKIASHQQDGSDDFLGFVMHTRLLSGA